MADEILNEEITNEEEAVKIVTTYEVEDNILKEVKTPDKVVAEVKTYNIEDIRAEITKIDNAIAQWVAKKAPLQAIVDKYEELNPTPEVEDIAIEEGVK